MCTHTNTFNEIIPMKTRCRFLHCHRLSRPKSKSTYDAWVYNVQVQCMLIHVHVSQPNGKNASWKNHVSGLDYKNRHGGI